MLLAAMLASAVFALVPAQIADAGARRRMIGTINAARAWSHLHRVHMSGRLSRGARAWARHLMRRNVIAHSSRALRRREGEVIEWHTGARAHVRNTVLWS